MAVSLDIALALFFFFLLSSAIVVLCSSKDKEEVQQPPKSLETWEIPSPKIMVVFQRDSESEDDEEVCKEIADMYISYRTYYYSGSSLPVSDVKEEKEMIWYEDIDFSRLEKINV